MKEKENFVRKNLRNKRGACKACKVKRKEFRARASARSDKFDGLSQDAEPKGNRGEHQSHGLAGLGLDPLQLSLDSMGAENQRDNNVLHHNNSNQCISSSESGPQLSRGLQSKKILSSASRVKSNRSNIPDEILAKEAPVCPGHQMLSGLCTVKKTGGNKGRKFYACAQTFDQRCNFFMWAEDNPALLSYSCDAYQSKAPAETWEEFALHSFKNKLTMLNIAGLKDNIRSLNRRMSYILSKGAKNLVLSGSKSELIEKIISAEKKQLFQTQDLITCTSLSREEALPCRPTESTEEVVYLDDSSSESGSESMEAEVCLQSISEDELLLNAPVNSMNVSTGHYSTRACGEADSGGEVILCDSGDDDSETETDTEPESALEEADADRRKAKEGEDSVTRVLQVCFGYSSFRHAQRWAINRVMSGLNSLLVMPTGAGESLCYMVPAVLLPGLTIVVSPLVALMNDQLKKLPVHLPGACMSGGLTTREMGILANSVLKGYIKVLFVSPERLCTNSFRNLISNLQYNANKNSSQGGNHHAISLLCLDEAHCMSSWSYNFRPAFLRIRREIQNMKPRAVLALTATAPPYIRDDIMSHLGVPPEGLSSAPYSRPNVRLFGCVARNEEERRKIILDMLKRDKTAKTPSSKRLKGGNEFETPTTIVYVWRRGDADSLSEFLVANGVSSSAYHAGMDADRRLKIQEMFDRGTVKVIVGTVSFGLGVDKADIEQVIHSCMPKSVEGYLQETGRAGRDGRPASCNLILSKEDFVIQHALVHSSKLTALQIYAMLSSDIKLYNNQLDTFIVRLDHAEQVFDIPAAAVETMLSILELPPYELVKVDGSHLDTVKGYMMEKPSDEDRDILLDAIVKLNKHTKPSHAEHDEYSALSQSNGMGFSASYGLGLNGGSGIQRCDAYQKYEFEISVYDISRLTGLSRDDIIKGFYALQKIGKIREYNLSNSAIYASFISSTNHHKFSSVSDCYDFIWQLSLRLHATLSELCGLEAKRVTDMWRMGSAIATCAAYRGTEEGEEGEEGGGDKTQLEITKFISYYMEHLNSNKPNETMSPIFLDGGSSSIATSFARTDIPLKRTDEITPAEIYADVFALYQEPRILSFLKDVINIVIKQKAAYSNKKVSLISIMKERQGLHALYISKVLQGLSTSVLPLSGWRQLPAWARCRHVAFGALESAVLDIVTKLSQTH